MAFFNYYCANVAEDEMECMCMTMITVLVMWGTDCADGRNEIWKGRVGELNGVMGNEPV
jgi:hypothetical protein